MVEMVVVALLGGRNEEGFVVELAVHQVFPHPVVVARVEFEVAYGAAEAGEMVDQLTGSHHHLVGFDTHVTPGAFLDSIPSSEGCHQIRRENILIITIIMVMIIIIIVINNNHINNNCIYP